MKQQRAILQIATAWIILAVENIAPLPAEESPAFQPADLFHSLDKNGDGLLTNDDVTGAQKRFFERALLAGDLNKDGQLNLEEFVAAHRELPAESPSPPASASQAIPAKPTQQAAQPRYEVFDRNRDGQLTLDEFPESMRDRLKPLFETAGKEALTIQAFAEAAQKALAEKNSLTNGSQLFQRLDQNSDGKLSKSEIPELLRPRFQPAFDRLGKEEMTLDEFSDFTRGLERGRNPQPPDNPSREEMRHPLPSTGSAGNVPGVRDRAAAARARLPRLFVLLDSDRNGRVSREELAAAGDHFGELDINSDGQLDPRELLGPPPEEPRFGVPPSQPDTPRERFMGDRIERLIGQFDHDSDGQLSKEEMPDSLKTHFDRMDADSDGFCSTEELRKGLGQLTRPPAGESDSASRLFGQFDLDGNGKLAQDEIPKSLQPILSRMDQDGDGILTEKELRESLLNRVRPEKPSPEKESPNPSPEPPVSAEPK